MSNELSKDQFDEFKTSVMTSLDRQYALSQSTNTTLGSNTTAIAVLQTQMGVVLEHVKAEQQRARDLKVAKITGAFALIGTIITAAFAWLSRGTP